MYQYCHGLLEINKLNKELISMYIDSLKETFTITLEDIKVGLPSFVTELVVDDQVLLKYCMDENSTIFIYALENKVYVLLETSEMSNEVFDATIHNYDQNIQLKRTGISTFELLDRYQNLITQIDDLYIEEDSNSSVDYRADLKPNEKILSPIAKVQYKQFYMIVTYNELEQKIKIKKVIFKEIQGHPNLKVTLDGHNKLVLENKLNGSIVAIPYTEVGIKKPLKIFGREDVRQFENSNILGIYTIENEKYYIYLKLNGVFIIKKRPGKVTQFKSYFKVLTTNKHLYIYGRMVHHAYNSFGKYEHLYSVDEKNMITKFKRPFRKVKFLKQFGFFKIPLEKMNRGERVHYPLFIGTEDQVIHKFPLGRKQPPSKNYSVKKVTDKVQVLRTNIYNQATYSIVPYSEMYSFSDQMKIQTAYVFSKLLRKKQNVNLYFEKQASKADESGFRVFEKVKEQKGLTSKNYFILDEHAEAYDEMKRKHGTSIVKRFSFKHYLSLFNADFFIGSDLSNHVINDRIYNNKIMDKVKETPLIFLQHGIMFAKPVENPLGKIFYKNYSAYNIHKNVVSSRLEAKEFYKMGYDDSDLIYTGLATFDYAKLNKKSDKIVYMPTYRYWEEGMIYNGDIEKTTYFKSLIKIINAFEAAGLRDKLIIVSHNKFAEYIRSSMGEYQDVLGTNPSDVLKEGRIFISDYSSAIYDAIYRGAYPIFYWEDKKYLAEKYQAEPPVNEENAPGPIAINAEEVVELAKIAMANNYQLEEEHKEKYLKINSFNDNRNTDRIVEFLENEQIL